MPPNPEPVAFPPDFPADEWACVAHLARLRWPGGFTCARAGCGGRRAYRIATRPRVFECAECGRQVSVTSGTAMHGSKLPLRHWFVATLYLGHDASSAATALADRLRIRHATAWELMHRVRACMTELIDRLVEGMIEAACVWIRCKPPPYAGRTTMISDMRMAWVMAISRIDEGDGGQVSLHFLRDDPVASKIRTVTMGYPVGDRPLTVLNKIDRLLGRVYRGVSTRWLKRYLAEYQFRYHRRAWPGDVHEDLLREVLRPRAARTWAAVRPPRPRWYPPPRTASAG